MPTGTYFIAAVRTEPGPGGRHDHIAFVKLTDGTILARSTVIARIRAGDRFYTVGNPPALVYVHRCPHCGTGDYITTHPDDTTKNNLLDLPRF